MADDSDKKKPSCMVCGANNVPLTPVVAVFSAFVDAMASEATSSKGPAQVATAVYRENYDAIFSAGRRQPVGQA